MAGISGQTLNDRLNAARYALAGQGLARVVCKATTEEMIAPKKKHIDYLLQCTNEPNVSIPQLANLLIERTTHSSWIVVFKSLVTVHHLMCYGNERFTQYLASSNSNFQLNNYTDKNAPRGYEMSTFIRRYARYLNAKALSYRTVAFDFTKVKRGSGDGQLRSMNIEKLLKTVPTLQNQIDALLEFDCNAGELNNGVINAAFFLLFKDLIRLFACYNDGIINCLEKYFEMSNKKQARETLETYKKFLIRMNKVAEFLKVAENVGIDKGEIPDLTKAPSSLLDAMEQHLAAMEGKKITPTSSTVGTNGEQKDENSLKKAIEEEEQFLNRLKTDPSASDSEKHLQEKKVVSNPFMDLAPASGAGASESKPAGSSGMLDLFTTDDTENANNNTNASSTVPSAAALAAATSNPFADILSAMTITPGAATAGATGTAAPPPGADAFATSDNFAAAFGTSSNSNVVNNNTGLYPALFDIIPPQARPPAGQQTATTPKKSPTEPGFDAFGDVLQPQNVSSSSAAATGGSTNLSQVPNSVPTNHFANLSSLSVSQHQSSNSATTSSSINHNSLSSPSLSSSAATGVGIAANATNNNSSNNNKNVPSSSSSQSLVKGDLDASLASLAQNLYINGPKGGGFINKKGPFNLSPQSTKKSGAPLNASGSSLLGGGGGSTNSSSGLGMMWNSNHMPSMSMMSQAQQNPMISSAGWSPNPGLGSTSIGGGVGGLWATGSAAGPMQPQMMMMGGVGTGGGVATAIHGQQQPLIMPNTSTMTLPFGIRPAAKMMPGAISVLPSGVTPAALSSALSSASVLSGNNSRTNQQQQQQQAAAADPFGAL